MSEAINEKTVNIKIKDHREIEAITSQSLHSTLAAAGIDLVATCGGRGTCKKCKVKVLQGQVADRKGTPVEPGTDGYHLACQVYPLEDLVLDKIHTQGTSSKGEIGSIVISKEELNSAVKKSVIKPLYPDLKNNYSVQEMIKQTGIGYPMDLVALRKLAVMSLPKPESLTAITVMDEITTVETGDTTKVLYGIAFDIGSTTVAGMLLDINKGKVIAAAAETNPQTVYGADVVSRIKAAATDEGLEKLSDVIRECLNKLISNLCAQAGLTQDDVYLMTIAGNSTMEHLLMSVSPSYLTQNPYVPIFNYIPPFSPSTLNLNINPGGRIVLLPNIASFVGADTVAAIIAVDQDQSDKMTLLLDLGTNGELAIGNKDKIVVCSTAAGPAFEGACLSCGMRAGDGAIDDVIVTDDITFTTVNQKPAKGICGSGVIKAIAQLLNAGVINPSGRMANDTEVDEQPPKLRDRLTEKNGQKAFVLAYANESGTGEDVYVSQGDIREIQLVKSSIFTGAQVLMEHIGITPDEVDQVLIAGAFGNFIDLESALTIGLIPQSDLKKVFPVGNAAGTGAVKALLSQSHLDRCYNVAKTAGFVELANDPEFQMRFVENLSFEKES